MDILLSSSSSSDESEYFIRKRKFNSERNFQERIDENYYSDEEFRRRFRFSKKNLNYLVKLIENDIAHNRGLPLTPKQKVMVALRYYATGCMQTVSGDLIGVTQSTACLTVHEVSKAFASLSRRFIKMPSTQDDRLKLQQEFYSLKKIPRVIGCIDCSHIPIKSPGGENAELYRNRKGYFSVNVQGVCDANCKFVNLIARWHGSAHDQTIFNFSKLKRRLESEEFGNSILIGDGGYGCTSYLITPYRNPTTAQEMAYNKALSSTRSCIERTFGMWKRRFSVLAKESQIRLDNYLTIIVATAVLYNIAIDLGDELSDDDDYIPIIENVLTLPPNSMEFNLNTNVRKQITQTF